MTINDLAQIATKGDLDILYKNLLREMQAVIVGKNPQKEFYNPKEFCHLTGQKYSTVLYKCKAGRIKARQDAPCCVWLIYASEIDRYKKEAEYP